MCQDVPRTEKNHFRLSFPTFFVFLDRENYRLVFHMEKNHLFFFPGNFAKNVNHAMGSSCGQLTSYK